ncbi:MAG: rod shape-determining protein RodA [Paramuribaculum sp.]|nr:rod shape-determining protein RodA [Paramuribaculum sp.]
MNINLSYNHNNDSPTVFRYIDWITIVIYLLLVIAGAISIYAASYDFDNASIFSFNEFSGKQITWIGLSLLLGMILLLIDPRIYETYAFPLYVGMLGLLLITIFIAPDIKGSHSWLVLGPVSLQPAEFAKVTTALALAKLFSGYDFNLTAKRKNFFKALAIIFLPVILILAQNETGSALVFMTLFFVLYREGMSGLVLLAALCAIVFFVVAVKYTEIVFLGMPAGEMTVYIMIMLIMVGMTAIYCRQPIAARNMLVGFMVIILAAWGLWQLGIEIDGTWVATVAIVLAVFYLIFLSFHEKAKPITHTIIASLLSVAFLFSVNYAFNDVLQPHQQKRIKVTLGMEEDLRGAGYNVNQSKIAIGSGGIFGKGFLNGTQTKLKYVPEQHTDFIFCTIGEEEGFIGSTLTLLMFLILILRVITIAERQPRAFGRVYGYCVASYLIFHLAVNVGMVIGLCPVIGIPLPFFSYGGSSLWGFTILLFVLLRIDASRRDCHNY